MSWEISLKKAAGISEGPTKFCKMWPYNVLLWIFTLICTAQSCHYPAMTREFHFLSRGKSSCTVDSPTTQLPILTNTVLLTRPLMARKRKVLYFINNYLLYIVITDCNTLFRRIITRDFSSHPNVSTDGRVEFEKRSGNWSFVHSKIEFLT
jgi:hypothetical protein